MTTDDFTNELIKAFSQPVLVLNTQYEVLFQSDRVASVSKDIHPGVLITNVLRIVQKESDSTTAFFSELLAKSVTSKQKLILTNCFIISLANSTQRFQGDIEIIPFADKNGKVYRLVVQITHSKELLETRLELEKAKQYEYQQELIQKEAHQDALFNSTDDLIWSVDTDFRIISCNNAFRDLAQLMSGKEFQPGSNALDVAWSEEQLIKWKNYYERALKGEKFSIKEETHDAIGELIHCSYISITPLLDKAGNIWGAACFGKDITAETKASKALAKANFELQNILSSSLDIICTLNAHGEFTNINAASYKVWGYDPAKLLHTNYTALLHPDDLEKTRAIAAEVISGMDVINFENRHIRKDGSIVPMIWSARWDVKSELMYCVGGDATEKERSEQELKASEKSFRLLVENSGGAMDILTTEGDTLYASASIKHVIGYDEHEALHLNLFDLLHPDDKNKVAEKLAESINNPGVPIKNYVCRIMHKDGIWRWIAATFTNLIDEPNINGIVNNFRDVTERVNDELQLKLLIDNSSRYVFISNAV
ncbi:MAG: PAS domain-containing protein, partial [Bacteroidota bacterium]